MASQQVAVKAGFANTGVASQFVPGTGESFEDLRYILGRRARFTNLSRRAGTSYGDHMRRTRWREQWS